jgi:hypothetical protein
MAAFRWEEQQATLLHNAPTFAHAVTSTEAILAALSPDKHFGAEKNDYFETSEFMR